ncbi:hypothetical protein SLEP1_g4878 [Rubroshorea leprosula]|uniref:Integrase catalytic domain-containing protein n=1 Tax=Rubroshorea leprosula TaxID=152421 RepID=A0AAV5HQ49_9ROSI|nr:hypothetical protein SLEP1_g4878 [Rubroshorea leprosula]
MVNTRSVRAGNSSQPLGRGQVPSNLPPHLSPPILNMFPLVDHVEGGDENQPHNSTHNSASTANQDVVVAQLASMQQQFAPQQNLEPVQHAPALSESQGQSHVAPAQQPLSDDVTRCLDSLEKLVAEQRGAPPSHHAANSISHPLNTNITLEPYSAGFKTPQLETYNGTKDPDDHLHAFYSCMQAQNAFDASYTEMASAFATKFSSRRLTRKTTFELMRVKQRNGESLKNYMSRFNDAVLEVSSFDQVVGIADVISSLNHERFRDSLLKHPATTFSEVNDRSLKFITTEKVVMPHNDPLVTLIMINNYQVQRVLVDTGSAPDVMYYHCFESLGLNPTLLQRYDGPIYGFDNQPIQVEGVLTMNVAFGSRRTYVTPLVRFLVVKMPSFFNVVIGRPTLIDIRAMVSQSRLCMKFPTPMGIATLRGNQEVAIHCYLTSVTRPQKDKDQPTENPPQEIHDNQQVMGVEILDNQPENETRAASGEDVEEVQIDEKDSNKKTQIGTRRVDYCEWVANPVLVKKANGKWRMCIDYNNLNQACPKDCYPMPNIDKLVEAASGNERLSLLDAYSSYHQVPMALEDKEKISFYAGNEIYRYVMMPFGLKNASATYQKMVTIVFRAQICRNLEVYVDDIVMKSLKAEDHLTDLEETFNNLIKNRVRLNPAKCIFGVELGKFLGFMVSRRGIEVNPEKIKAVAEMEPPKSVKDVQRLTRRVAALHRFILKSADKCLPFFKIMRLAAQKDESGKQKKFEWNSEFQAVFDELKSYLSSPSLLTKANDGEILYLYLGILDEAISFVLLREEGRQQKPVYYTSSVLHEAEIRYSIAEKAALAVQRSAIQAQALVDFIIECTSTHFGSQLGPDSWILYVDGSSSNKGSGASVILLGPDGYRSEHALKFNFDATNNMAEYEALLLSLQLAIELKVHEGVCGSHIGARTLVHKVLRQAEELTNLVTPWPFAQCGLDLLGPFMKGIVADNGTQFNCSSFRDFCSSYGIKLQFTSVYHSESNGMVEFVNKKIANFYNKQVRPRTFKVGDLVVRKVGLTRFETRFEKLAPNWKGPYTVVEVPHPDAYILQDIEGKRVPRV